MNMRARGARGVAQDRNKVQGVRPADGHNGCHIKRAHLRGPRHVPSAATSQYGVWRRRASDAHHSASGRNLRNLQAQSASCARRGGYRSLARPVFRRRWPGRVGDIWAQFRNRVSSRLPTSSVKPSKAAKTYQYVATFCRPLMFSRPDGTHGFEEFRRDAEDRGAWTPVQYYSGRVYSSREGSAGRRLAQFLQGREVDAGRNERRQPVLCRQQSRQGPLGV